MLHSKSVVFILLDQAQSAEGPYPQDDFSDDHVIAHASDGGVAAVDAGAAVIAQDEVSSVGDLEG